MKMTFSALTFAIAVSLASGLYLRPTAQAPNPDLPPGLEVGMRLDMTTGGDNVKLVEISGHWLKVMEVVNNPRGLTYWVNADQLRKISFGEFAK